MLTTDRQNDKFQASQDLFHCGGNKLSLLPSAERKMSTGQSAVTLCGWVVKAGMVHSTCNKRVGGR